MSGDTLSEGGTLPGDTLSAFRGYDRPRLYALRAFEILKIVTFCPGDLLSGRGYFVRGGALCPGTLCPRSAVMTGRGYMRSALLEGRAFERPRF